MNSPRPAVRRAELLDRVAHAPSAQSLFERVGNQLRRLVPSDAAVLAATDPETGLMTAPVRVENLGEGGCATYWDTELLDERVNRYRDLARAAVPAVALRHGTGDRPELSAAYRKFLRPRGFDDELRVVLRVGRRPYGQISLFRSEGRRAFDAADLELMAGLSTPLARRLRTYAEPAAVPVPGTVEGPGMLVFDTAGSLVSVNDEAREYLADMAEGPGSTAGPGVRLPAWVHSTVAHARSGPAGTARIRLRTRGGRWLICHASPVRDESGTVTSTVMVIEPAKVSQVLSLVVEAYDLSERELDVTRLVARGLSTDAIAGQLHLSPHTVRDHVKAIFDKVGVTSRGELVAKLFTEYYEPLGTAGTQRCWSA